ncbi:MAG: class I SAM-dependent methyltransferase [Bacteroidales bacterium]|nr:class I SAM-dependent methyltransferase [Bacteroidales bacterium]
MQRVNLIFRYLSYKLFARHKYGHGIHSPFVYSFIKKVLNGHEGLPCFQIIEKTRKQYLKRNESIVIHGYGAGSRTSKKNIRRLREIVRTSAVSAKYGRMLSRLVAFYQPEFIAELGTSAGISTAYLASAKPSAKVITAEGNSDLAKVAAKTFHDLNLKNVELITDTFENALQHMLRILKGRLLVFIDGDHQYQKLLSYFRKVLDYPDECLIVLDDIRWSVDMLKAWKEIISDPRVKVSIDLFLMGMAFLNTNIHKQHFVIRF